MMILNMGELDQMSKTISCPNCGSPKKVKIYKPNTPVQENSQKCSKCSYQDPVVIEDGNLVKQIKNLTKMDKLSKKTFK